MWSIGILEYSILGVGGYRAANFVCAVSIGEVSDVGVVSIHIDIEWHKFYCAQLQYKLSFLGINLANLIFIYCKNILQNKMEVVFK